MNCSKRMNSLSLLNFPNSDKGPAGAVRTLRLLELLRWYKESVLYCFRLAMFSSSKRLFVPDYIKYNIINYQYRFLPRLDINYEKLSDWDCGLTTDNIYYSADWWVDFGIYLYSTIWLISAKYVLIFFFNIFTKLNIIKSEYLLIIIKSDLPLKL